MSLHFDSFLEEGALTDTEVLSDVQDSFTKPDLNQKLASWATRNYLTRTALDELLILLREQDISLPKDSRNLLNTPRHSFVVNKCGGQYAYFGIEASISSVLRENPHYSAAIELQVNIDGVLLFKSTRDAFWPILIRFHTFKPCLVALFCGNEKPNYTSVFLADFFEEYHKLKTTGICQASGNILPVFMKCFICDAPARSFLKDIKGHSGFYSCERCTVRGIKIEGRTVLNNPGQVSMRTDQGFNEQRDTDHQKGKSPLIDHGISCVSGFPLDYMHLICLGVVKRVLTYLKKGPRICKLSSHQINAISEKLLLLNGKLPTEFARQPRSLSDLTFWKAKEFRQFLLYTGPLVLKHIVKHDIYVHFVSLSVAVSILLQADDRKRNAYVNYAEELLDYYVAQCSDVFGSTFNVYNVHNLTHITDDVKHFKCSLNDISAFPFVNHLHWLKRLVRKAQNPISQVHKRIAEFQHTIGTG